MNNDSRLKSPPPKKPDDTILRLFNILVKDGISTNVKTKHFIIDTRINGGNVFLIEQGYFSIRRCVDDIHVSTGCGPAVLGLQEIFSPAPWHYIKLLGPAKVWRIPVDVAHQRINSSNAWRDVAEILSYYLRSIIFHEECVVGKTSYELVVFCMREYLKFKGVYMENKIGIVKYIMDSTGLSRSQVFGMVSNLKKGGYIETSHGKLIEVHYLPEKY